MSKINIDSVEQFEEFIGETKQIVEIENVKTGEVATLGFLALDAKHIGKLIYVQERMPKPKLLNPNEAKSDANKARYETPESMMARLQEEDYDVYSKLYDVLTLWVQGSYPGLSDEKAKLFVMKNQMLLSEAFLEQHANIDVTDAKTKVMKEFLENSDESSKQE